MRLFKELVFHNGLLEHQRFSENPPKMDFFCVSKRFQQEIFSATLRLPDLVLLVSKTTHGYFQHVN